MAKPPDLSFTLSRIRTLTLRTPQCLPEEAANELLQTLLEQRRITPPQLELFRHSATSVRLGGPSITPAWLAALGSFSALHELRLQRCTKLRDAALKQLVPLAPHLRVLDLQGCSGLGDAAAVILAQMAQLVDLNLAGTGLGAAAVAHLVPALTQLTALDLSDLPVDDSCCTALAGLTQLRRLRLASTAVGDGGMGALEALPALTSLDVSFTEVRPGTVRFESGPAKLCMVTSVCQGAVADR